MPKKVGLALGGKPKKVKPASTDAEDSDLSRADSASHLSSFEKKSDEEDIEHGAEAASQV